MRWPRAVSRHRGSATTAHHHCIKRTSGCLCSPSIYYSWALSKGCISAPSTPGAQHECLWSASPRTSSSFCNVSTSTPGSGAPRRQACTVRSSNSRGAVSRSSSRLSLSTVLASASASEIEIVQELMSAECKREGWCTPVCRVCAALQLSHEGTDLTVCTQSGHGRKSTEPLQSTQSQMPAQWYWYEVAHGPSFTACASLLHRDAPPLVFQARESQTLCAWPH